jgi:hypothetical protein
MEFHIVKSLLQKNFGHIGKLLGNVWLSELPSVKFDQVTSDERSSVVTWLYFTKDKLIGGGEKPWSSG